MILRRTIFTFFYSCIWVAPLVAQHDAKDSLNGLLQTRLDPEKRVDVLNQLAYHYYDFNDTLASNFASESLRLAEQSHYLKGMKYALIMVGVGYTTKSEFKKAIHYFRLSEAVNAKGAEGDATYGLTLTGNCYREIANYDSAIFFYRKAKALGANDKFSMANVYKHLASVYILLWRNEEAIAMLDSANILFQNGNSKDQYVAVDMLTMYGQVYKNILKYDLSEEYYQRMCKESERIEDYYHQIMCKLNYADLAFQQSNYTEALKFSFEALELTKKYVYAPQYVKVLIEIGEIYEEISQLDIAAEYFFKALAIAERIGLRAETALCLSQLAWINKDQHQYVVAIDYANKSLKIRESIGDKKGIANCHNVLGLIYLLQKNYPQSIKEHEIALRLREQIGYKLGISASIFNLSLTYEAMGQLNKALEFQLKSLEMEETSQNKQGLAISYNSVAQVLIKLGKMEEALSYANKASRLGIETGSTLLKRNTASSYVGYYQAVGNFKKAFEYQQRYQELNDSVYSEASALKLAEVEAIYNVEKKEKDIELLKQREAAQANQLQLQQTDLSRKNLIIAFAITGMIVLATSVFVGFRYYNEKSKANKELTEKQEEIQAQSEELAEASEAIANINKELEVKIEERTSELKQAYKELDTFFYRASHDFRRPITTFMGLAGVAKVTVKDPASLELFEKVNETATSLDKMLHKLQSISDVGSQQMIYKEVFLKELIDEALDGYSKIIQQKKIIVSFEVKEETPLITYPAMVKIIIENLIENAIHFAGFDNPFVKIKAFVNDSAAVIEVKDNGQGIMDEYKSRIFEMYFRANEHSKGNGLGLYIARKASEKLGGRISFDSKYGLGSVFTVELPNQEE